jgi:hypothetical protein
MNKGLLAVAAGALCVSVLNTSAYAVVIKVDNLGSILDASVSFPSTSTPGSGKAFADYFEFTLPVAEYVSASVSLSGPTGNQIPKNKGDLTLADWTSTGSVSPFIPMGATLEQATISPPASGGQGAFVGTFTSQGDYEPAGNYFVEVSGISGGGALKLAIDGNVTSVAVPELSTWAMLFLGFAGLGFAGYRNARQAISIT